MTGTDAPSSITLERRFFDAVCAGDAEALREIYSPAVAVWHNYDGIEQTRDESIRTLSWLHRRVGPMRYRDIDTIALDDGFIRSHVAILAGGDIEMAAMLRVRVDASRTRIERIDEYVDPAPLNHFLRP